MKTKLIFPLVVFVSCLLTTCKKDDETNGNCGAKAFSTIFNTQYEIFEDSVKYEMQYQYDEIKKITTVTFYSEIYDSICTDEHIKVAVEIDIDTSGWAIDPIVRADWYPLFGSEIDLTSNVINNKIHYYGSYQIGLKQTWGDGPGMFYLTWSFSFPSQNTKKNDIIWLNNRVLWLSIDCNYFWYRN